MRGISLFSGVGGLDLAVEVHGVEIVAQVENEPYCRDVLAERWPGVPCYGDIKEVDWHEFLERYGPVDLVVAGFPCQPTSNAGRRQAQEDARWLWPEVARCLRVLRPGLVFLENTLGLLSRGFNDVLGELAALGFDAEWDCLQAADVGAPHERDRVFVLAYAQGEQRRQGGEAEGERLGRSASGGLALAVAGGPGLEVGSVQSPRQELSAAQRGRAPVAEPPGSGRGRPGSGRQPGRPSGPSRWLQPGRLGEADGRLGQSQPGVGRGLDGVPGGLDRHCWPAPPGPDQHPWEPPRTVPGRSVPDRGRRVKALGNAVVPQQGALAFGLLWQRMLEVA